MTPSNLSRFLSVLSTSFLSFLLYRHVYEIIREGYPCRLYFDLEFPKKENPLTNGDDLTSRWIQLVLWKLYEYFGLCLGLESVVDMDSSTDKKFSRHITFIIRGDTGIDMATLKSSDMMSEISHHKIEDESQKDRELLFLNNIEVGKFVFCVVNDMLLDEYDDDIDDNYKEAEAEYGKSDQDRPSKAQSPSQAAVHRPYSEFREFWLLKDGKPMFFADLGVYTRNRAFRLFSSSKYGKTAALRLAKPDITGTGVNSLVNQAILGKRKIIGDDNLVNTKLTNETETRKALMSAILGLTFVLPAGIVAASSCMSAYDDDDLSPVVIEKGNESTHQLYTKCVEVVVGGGEEKNIDTGGEPRSDYDEHDRPSSTSSSNSSSSSSDKYYAVDSQEGTLVCCHLNVKNLQNYLVVPSIFHPKAMTQHENKRTTKANSNFSIAQDWQQLKRPRSYIDEDSHISASNIMPSPFPALDDFVLKSRAKVCNIEY